MSKLTNLSRLATRSLVVALLVCLVALTATAQTQPGQRRDPTPATASPTPSPSTIATTATTTTDNQDLSITANVTARELLFEVVPNPKVEFTGQPRRDTVWEAERTNLPAQVQPGVTYRDIGIRLKITSVFADIERIVAEALGEVPASDGNDTPQTPGPKTDNAPPQTENTPRPTTNEEQTNAASQATSAVVPQAAASTGTSRTASAKATTARPKDDRRAPLRRGRN